MLLCRLLTLDNSLQCTNHEQNAQMAASGQHFESHSFVIAQEHSEAALGVQEILTMGSFGMADALGKACHLQEAEVGQGWRD